MCIRDSPGKLTTLEEAKHLLDLYDDGVKYTDDNIGQIIGWLKDNGLYDDDLAIIITADHGEDLGEFGIYGEHGTADEPVCRIPMIVRWPGDVYKRQAPQQEACKSVSDCDVHALLPVLGRCKRTGLGIFVL